MSDTKYSQTFWFCCKTPTSVYLISENKACAKGKGNYFTGPGKATGGV